MLLCLQVVVVPKRHPRDLPTDLELVEGEVLDPVVKRERPPPPRLQDVVFGGGKGAWGAASGKARVGGSEAGRSARAETAALLSREPHVTKCGVTYDPTAAPPRVARPRHTQAPRRRATRCSGSWCS